MSNSIEYQKISQHSEELQESSEEMNVNASSSILPSSQSSSHLIVRSHLGDSESVLNQNVDDEKSIAGRTSRLHNSETRSGYSSVTSKEWFTVAVLCFINLINYMDRFTIAGKISLSLS